jgi:2-octaprenylphenol hydroxylase
MANKKRAIAVRGSGIISHMCAIMLDRSGYEVLHITSGTPLQNDSFFAITPSAIDWLRSIGFPESFFDSIHEIRKMDLLNVPANEKYSFDADELFVDNLAFMVKQKDFICALTSINPTSIKSVSVNDVACTANHDHVNCVSNSQSIEASLLVVCDAEDEEISSGGFGRIIKHYDQEALTFSFHSKEGRFDCASQYFFEDSILALLPLDQGEVGVVWSCNSELKSLLSVLTPEAFKSYFEERLNKKFTVDSALDPKKSFNLKSKSLDHVFNKRILAIGDAAHIIHPLAGQGLNLGLRDIRAIELLLSQGKVKDAGNKNFLRKYERMRKKDVSQLSFLTDSLSNTVHNNYCIHKLNKHSSTPKAISSILNNRLLKKHIVNQATQ